MRGRFMSPLRGLGNLVLRFYKQDDPNGAWFVQFAG